MLLRAVGVVGWRRSVKLRFAAGGRRTDDRGRRLERGQRKAEDGGGKKGRRTRIFAFFAAESEFITIRPDFVFPQQRLAVFVDGCFWHGCPKHATWPKNNAAFWRAKIEGNMARDRLQDRLLRKNQWRVIRIWGHDLTPKFAMRTLARLRRLIADDDQRTVKDCETYPRPDAPV